MGKKVIRNLSVFIRKGDPDSERLIARLEQMRKTDLFYVDEFNVGFYWMNEYGPEKLRRLSNRFGVIHVPSVLLKDGDGKVLWRYNSLPSYVELRQNIEM